MTPQQKYNAAHTRAFSLRLNYQTDGYLIDMLDASGNAQGLVKRALMEYYDNHRMYNQGEATSPQQQLRAALADAERAAATIRAVLQADQQGKDGSQSEKELDK